MSNTLTRLIKEPLIQFLLIGTCIYGAYAVFAPPEAVDQDTLVRVDANRINSFVAQWTARWNRPPTRNELDGIINNYVREEILYRQAVIMGLNQDDPINRRRMAQRLEFLTSDIARLVEPEEGELEVYFEDNIELFSDPDHFSFIQIFFDPDKRDETTLDDAATALAELQAIGVPDPAAIEAGDQLMLENYFDSVTELEIRKRLGSGFTDEFLTLEPGIWHGPVLSGFGVHLVYILERVPAPRPILADMRAAVLDEWHRDRLKDFNEQFYEALKARYEIIIEDADLAPGSVLQVGEAATEPGEVPAAQVDE